MTTNTFEAKFPEIQKSVPLSSFSAFKIGGPADYFYDCKDIKVIPDLVVAAKESNLPTIIIGGGSNTVFNENGFRGLIIKLSSFNLNITDEIVTADAGIILNALIMQVLKHDLIGMENLFGIPGTLGGAIRGNAGAHGTEIQDLLQDITYYDPDSNQIITRPKAEFDFSYRNSTFKLWQQSSHPKYILKATLKLRKNPERAQSASTEIFQIQKVRNAKYPSEPNCGSFFKNPSQLEAADLLLETPDIPLSSGNVPAGWLSERAGCKGLKIGDAQVSEKHGNFFINLGAATQTDLLELAHTVQSKIRSEFGITLEKEVQFISETGVVIE